MRRVTTYSPRHSCRLRAAIGAALIAAIVAIDLTPLGAAGGRAQPATSSAPAERGGTSLAEKIACVYLLVGGSIMLYYGPREKENGVLTNDGRSEAIGGAGAIGLSVALMHDIFKKRRRQP